MHKVRFVAVRFGAGRSGAVVYGDLPNDKMFVLCGAKPTTCVALRFVSFRFVLFRFVGSVWFRCSVVVQ